MYILEMETAIDEHKKKEHYKCCKRTVFPWYIVREGRGKGGGGQLFLGEG